MKINDVWNPVVLGGTRRFRRVTRKPRRSEFRLDAATGVFEFSKDDENTTATFFFTAPVETFSITPAGRKALAEAKAGKR